MERFDRKENTMKKRFKITRSTGFHITFPNGITLSTQFGPGCYGDNYYMTFDELEKLVEEGKNIESNEVEIAIWDKNGKWITSQMIAELFPDEDDNDIMAYVNIEKWLKIFHWCENRNIE